MSDSESSDDFIDKVSKLPLRFEPGTKYYYSISTDVLGILIERISEGIVSEFSEARVSLREQLPQIRNES